MSSSRKRTLEEAKEAAAAEKKKQKGTQTQRTPHGLYNQGATCYLNSVLQVLFMTTEIHDRLDPKSQVADEELKNIFETLEERTCETENITQSLGINVYQQRDAAEFLELILSKVSPSASEVFRGELRHTTKCSDGHSINEETDPFWTLPLSLMDDDDDDTTLSVERGFKSIFRTKRFGGDNMVYCDGCEQKTKATSDCEMVKSPQILTVLLRRFDFDYSSMSHFKSDRCVDVPPQLQLKDKTYKLYGMVHHMGSLHGGHYTATIRSNEDQTWYQCDDSEVSRIEEQPFAKTKTTYSSSTAYLLVYRESRRDEAREQQDEAGHLEEPRKLSPQGRREKPEEKPRRASSSDKDTSGSTGQRLDKWTTAEKRRRGIKKGEADEASPQPRSSSHIRKNPLLIFLIVFGCALIVILLVIIITLTRP